MIALEEGRAGLSALAFSEPLAVTDVAAEPLLEEQAAAYRDERITSMLVCPMRLGPARSGTLVFYSRTPQTFSEIDVQTGHALANLAAAALTTAELYDEQRAQRDAADRANARPRSLPTRRAVGPLARVRTDARRGRPTGGPGHRRLVRGGHRRRARATATAGGGRMSIRRSSSTPGCSKSGIPADPQAGSGVHEVIRSGKPG